MCGAAYNIACNDYWEEANGGETIGSQIESEIHSLETHITNTLVVPIQLDTDLMTLV